MKSKTVKEEFEPSKLEMKINERAVKIMITPTMCFLMNYSPYMK